MPFMLIARVVLVLVQITAPATYAQSNGRLPAPLLWGGVWLVEQPGSTLEFTPLKGARSYRVLLSRRQDFNPIRAEDIVVAPAVRVPPLPDGDYFLRVHGIDDHGLEGSGATARLRVRLRAAAPPPQSAAGNERETTNRELTRRESGPACLVEGQAGLCAVYAPRPRSP